MSEKIGVYICQCGANIAEAVDVETVAAFASSIEDVAVARTDMFLCSGSGQETIKRDRQEKGITRVVIAACSPHMHEATFRAACERAGLNPFLLEITNIREQDAWVTGDIAQATEKAKALVAAAVSRVRLHEPLQPMRVPINPETLVVGGGIAGITAALEIANAGRRVYLVERRPSIGGHMAQLDKTFPTFDCSACMLHPRMAAVKQHPHITLLTWSGVEAVKGYIGNFTVTVRKRARSIDESRCTGCGICVQKCPRKVIDTDFEEGLGYRHACYKPFAGAVPDLPVIDREHCSFFETGQCMVCEKECPAGAIDYNQEDALFDLSVGSIVLATGFDLFDPRQVPQYGYGRYADVFSSIEFERMLSSAGPTGGKIVLRDGATEPASVAIIHCVGSRDKNYREYCSRICCLYSLKFAHLIKERTRAEVYNFYIDMRAGGKTFEELYHKLLEEGVHFIRGRAAAVMDTAYTKAEERKLVVQAEDTLLGVQRRIPVDMVILSPAIEARADAGEVAHTFGIGCDAAGFFSERHPKLDPVATLREGVFIAGACQGPKDIADTVAQAGAAASRVLALISRGEVELEPLRARIDDGRCSGCGICCELCPYGAIAAQEGQGATAINPALCQGCGVCVAACPSRAITGAHFTAEQVMAEIEGILYDRNKQSK
ncbi:MAG: CoB--CoM heterodisulfide reductase iron-sulfur subunit A family protein [Nitrospirota bacterium]